MSFALSLGLDETSEATVHTFACVFFEWLIVEKQRPLGNEGVLARGNDGARMSVSHNYTSK